MSTTKNKGGRPPRAPGEKLQRINLTLRPSLLFGLEVVARDRRTSLSQAAEYLIEQQLREYQVDGVAASKVVSGVAAVMTQSLQAGNPLAIPVEDAGAEQMATQLLSSAAGRAFFMPESLQSPSERYFREVYGVLLKRTRNAVANGEDVGPVTPVMVVMNSLGNPDLLEYFSGKAAEAEQAGLSAAQAAEQLHKELVADIAANP
ncbi:TPA: hypothetical protein ACKQCD_001150 [Stenotrophomonas maltophilia]